jgi:glycosyltransferase involved in cell wall biosynthesis
MINSDKPVTILIINCVTREWNISGDARRLVGIINQFYGNGIMPEIIEYSQYPLDYNNSKARITRVKKITRDGLIGTILNSIYILMISLRKSYKEGIKAVYINQPACIENSFPGFIISKIMRKPFIVITHHYPIERKLSAKRLFSFWNYQGLPKKSLLGKIVLVFLRRFFFAYADINLAVSKTTAREVKELDKPRHLFVVGNGIDKEFFRNNSKEEVYYDACYVGRLSRSKGIVTLLKSWRMVINRLPNAKLVIVGEGPSEDYFKDMVNRLSLANNVQFTGWVTDEDLHKILKRSKIFLFPSRVEGFALAVAEAMASGLCCIISDIPVFRENFSGGAIFVQPDEPEKFADKTIYFLINEKERIRVAAQAHSLAKSFSWESVAKRESIIIKNFIRQ